MKTKHIFLLATLLALVACKSDEPSNDSNNSSSDNAPSLLGTWKWTGQEKGDPFTITVVFNNDNTAIIKKHDSREDATATASYAFDGKTNKLQVIFTGGESDKFIDDEGLVTLDVTWLGDNQILLSYYENEYWGPFVRQ